MSTATQAPATVAVIGTGAVGCYYGARLAEGGHDVRFLVRQGIDAVRENGIHVTSHLGDLHLPKPTLFQPRGTGRAGRGRLAAHRPGAQVFGGL